MPDASLRKQLGVFGGPHSDKVDNKGRITNVTAYSDLPADYDPGNFYLLYLGIFAVLSPMISVNFCGVRYHGGSPPTAPPGSRPVE